MSLKNLEIFNIFWLIFLSKVLSKFFTLILFIFCIYREFWLFSFPPPCGEEERECSMIFSNIPSLWVSTSWFQNLKISNPCPLSHWSRILSSSSSAYWPPSTSMIHFFSKLTKSTIYRPMTPCLQNFTPRFPRRSSYQRYFSVSVASFHNFLEFFVNIFFTPPSRTFLTIFVGGGNPPLKFSYNNPLTCLFFIKLLTLSGHGLK